MKLGTKGLPSTSYDARLPRRARDVSSIEENEKNNGQEVTEPPQTVNAGQTTTEESVTLLKSLNSSSESFVNTLEYTSTPEAVQSNTSETFQSENSTASYWQTVVPISTEGEEEFVNQVVSEYEDSKEQGSAMDLNLEPKVMANKLSPVLLELHWLPPRPPTTVDGFNIYIYRDGEPAFHHIQVKNMCL